ncbi:20801_t:CDS:1, partial [Gigaspora rosea]
KAPKKKAIGNEDIESYYVPELLIEDDNEGLTNIEKNSKQVEGKLGLKMVLESLANAYLEVLKNWIPEFTKPEEPKP